MSMMVSFVLSFFPRDVLDEILNLIESVSEDFPSYSCIETDDCKFLTRRSTQVVAVVFLLKHQYQSSITPIPPLSIIDSTCRK